MVVLVVAGCSDQADTDAVDDDAVDDDAVTLPMLGGDVEIDVGAPSARPRVVNVWATWCAPCRRELPAFDRVAAATDEVEILGVNAGEDAETARGLVDELGLTFPQLVDERSEVSARYGVVQMPSTVFLDADGDVARVHAGVYDDAGLVAAIDELLGVQVNLTP